MPIPHYPRIEDTIQRYAERYVMVRRGRGPTHDRAYREGAKKVLELLRSGEYSIEDIKKIPS